MRDEDGSLMAQLLFVKTLNTLLAHSIYNEIAKADMKRMIMQSCKAIGTKTMERMSGSLVENMEILKILIHLYRQFGTDDDPTIVSFEAHIPRLITEINSKL